jgi:dienelactone hydrolase
MSQTIDRREFLRQGSLAGVLANGGLPAVTWQPPNRGADAAAAGRVFDSRDFSLSTCARVVPSLPFGATDRRTALAWQRRARAKVTELLGGFPAGVRVPLQPEIVEQKDLGAYTREKVVFQTRADLTATGYLLVPKDRPRNAPALVCLPGHGRGAAQIVGIDEDGADRVAGGDASKPMAIQAVEHGFVTFALEQLGFGERRDEAARGRGPAAYSCQPAAGAALLMGQTMVGWRVWDVMRTIDYLSTRPEVDASRIGTLGVSGGGTTSLFSAAMDERIKAGVVSAYFNTFRDSILSISHCMCNYVPRMIECMEMHDIAGLIAPRFLFVESGSRDPIFPVEGSRRAIGKAESIYRVFGVPESFGHEIWDGAHGFNGRGAFAFLGTRL